MAAAQPAIPLPAPLRMRESWKANQRATKERRRHVADAAKHDRRSDADVTDFRWKYLVREDIDTTERDADESFTEHRERHGSHVIFCTHVQFRGK